MPMRLNNLSLLCAAALMPAALLWSSAPARQGDGSSRAVFERRILPILKSPNPSSCAECHLSGVDLKQYVRPTEAETFASLRDAGMIDLKQPDNSHLLKLIRMSRPNTPLVRQQAREAEYQAFRDWIVAAAHDPKMMTLPTTRKPIGPALPGAVIRHERMDSVLASFVRNVWSQQGRCMGCHTPGTDDYRKNVEKYGERVHWFIPDSPEATMRRLIEWKLIDVDKPEDSLLLLKPLNKVPHGGGVKFLYGDAGYKQFRAWIEDYAASVKRAYRSAADLPKPGPALVYTDCILNVTGTPDAWGDRLLRVDIYGWDAARGAWSAQPVATGDRGVWAKGHSTNVLVFLRVPSGGAEEHAARANPRLAPGRYLLKYYCDTTGRLTDGSGDYRAPTDQPAYYQGQQEITTDWKTGWGSPTKVEVALTK